MGEYSRGWKGDTRSLDYSTYLQSHWTKFVIYFRLLSYRCGKSSSVFPVTPKTLNDMAFQVEVQRSI